jgi:hypothetical protein
MSMSIPRESNHIPPRSQSSKDFRHPCLCCLSVLLVGVRRHRHKHTDTVWHVVRHRKLRATLINSGQTDNVGITRNLAEISLVLVSALLGILVVFYCTRFQLGRIRTPQQHAIHPRAVHSAVLCLSVSKAKPHARVVIFSDSICTASHFKSSYPTVCISTNSVLLPFDSFFESRQSSTVLLRTFPKPNKIHSSR